MKLTFIQNYILNAIATDKAEDLDWACIQTVRETYSAKALLLWFNNKVMVECGGDYIEFLTGLGLSIAFYTEDIEKIGYKTRALDIKSTADDELAYVSNWFKFLKDEIFKLSEKENAFSELSEYGKETA